jgi:hypothetical protein
MPNLCLGIFVPRHGAKVEPRPVDDVEDVSDGTVVMDDAWHG